MTSSSSCSELRQVRAECDVRVGARGAHRRVVPAMKYMVVETFAPGCKQRVYERFGARGRLLPDGLRYLDSWLEKDGSRCFQLMETESPELFALWIEAWKDLVDFEVIELEPR